MVGNAATVRRGKDSLSNNGIQSNLDEKSSSSQQTSDSSKSNNDSIIDPECLTLWQHPIITLNYFLRELFIDILTLAKKTLRYKKTVWILVLLFTLFVSLSRISGPQQKVNHRNQ